MRRLPRCRSADPERLSLIGELRGAPGFDPISSLDAGVEFDSSAYPAIVTRTRLPGRFQIGEGVSGWLLGRAVSC